MGKSREVDGFRLVQAVKLAKDHAGGKPREPPARPPPSAPDDRGAEKVSRIGTTARPTKHEVICYLCSYVFPVAGSPLNLVCPKCRRPLDRTDYTLASEGAEDIQTTGTVRLAPDAVLTGGTIVAREVTIEGRLAGGQIRAQRLVALAAQGSFDAAAIQAPDLRVAAAGAATIRDTASYRNVDIHGALTASLEAGGVVTIHPGGCFAGRLRCAHLIVEDGGGLRASVTLAPQPEDKRRGPG